MTAAASDTLRFDARHGHAELSRPAPGVALVRYVGGITEEVAADVQARVEQWLASRGGLALFVDAADMASYTPGFRKRWTSWLGDNKDALSGCHILVKSSLVRMGVNIVNPLIGGYITAHSNRETFGVAMAAVAVSGRAVG